MPKEKRKEKKSKSSEIVSDGMIEKLLNSDSLEDVKLGVKVLDNRLFLKNVDKKFQARKAIEEQRQKEYYQMGYGHILSNDPQVPMSTRDKINNFLNGPTWEERKQAMDIKAIQNIRALMGQSMFYLTILLAGIIFL